MFYAEATGPIAILASMAIGCLGMLLANGVQIFFLLKVVWARRNSLAPTIIPWVSNFTTALQAYSYEFESIPYWAWFVSFLKVGYLVFSMLLLGEMCKRPWIYPGEIFFLGLYVIGSVGIIFIYTGVYIRCEVETMCVNQISPYTATVGDHFLYIYYIELGMLFSVLILFIMVYFLRETIALVVVDERDNGAIPVMGKKKSSSSSSKLKKPSKTTFKMNNHNSNLHHHQQQSLPEYEEHHNGSDDDNEYFNHDHPIIQKTFRYWPFGRR